eukprot:6949544-Prymnesium_polylepis.1
MGPVEYRRECCVGIRGKCRIQRTVLLKEESGHPHTNSSPYHQVVDPDVIVSVRHVGFVSFAQPSGVGCEVVRKRHVASYQRHIVVNNQRSTARGRGERRAVDAASLETNTHKHCHRLLLEHDAAAAGPILAAI